MNPQFTAIGNTLVIAMTTVSTEVPIGGGLAANVIRVYNDATAVAHFKLSAGGGKTATNTDNFIAPKVTELFSVDGSVTHIAAVLENFTGNLYVIRGCGQ